jgi:hypothetical protein
MATFRLSRLAEADLLDIATYTLNTWGQDRPSVTSTILKPVAGGLRTTPNWAAPAITFGPACAAWNTGGTFCSTASQPVAS